MSEPRHFQVGDGAGPDADADTGDQLDELVARDADARVEDALERVRGLVDRVRSEDADQPLEPQIVAALEQLTAADDASLEAKAIRRRVDAGALTWRRFWSRPQGEEGGLLLWTAVQQAVAAGNRAAVEGAVDAEAQRRRDDPDAPPPEMPPSLPPRH